MRRRRFRGIVLGCALLAASVPTDRAQEGTGPTQDTPNRYPPALPPRQGPAPPGLILRLDAEIPLPGPLAIRSLTRDGQGVIVALAEGSARVHLDGDPAAELLPAPANPDERASGENPAEWVVSPDGKYRFRAVPEGRILAERRGVLFGRDWRRRWSLKVGGGTPAPPLLAGRRLCFGALDDRVYCVRRKNGHRLWAVDVEDRISRPLGLWRGTAEPEPAATSSKGGDPLELLLVVPDGGAAVLGLDPYDGSRLAVFDLPPSGGRLVTSALPLPDGRIAVARQSYATTDAALLLLRVVASPTAARKESPLAHDAQRDAPGRKP